MRKFIYVIFCFVIFNGNHVGTQPHNWNSPSEVVKKIKKKYSEINNYKAEFLIETVYNKKSTTMKGSCVYKSPGKIRYDFTEPEGDIVVSNGKFLWIYLKKIEAVGKQDLSIQKEDSSGKPIFTSMDSHGLSRLFRKYHYRFESIQQPKKDETDNRSYFVLSLEQREKIGGFENITLYVDSENYLIKKAIANDSRGKTTTIVFSKMELNTDMEDGIFNYRIGGNVKIINNPLVSDNK
ncbi:MAG: outer membrane lipoprotein carrier protein LolA [Leptospiraceae bacterium]|nr:outer membrane lipoprotein carrier protein LolA [Leptospiraceae bacterium]MCP5495173.1 outer membrane lipoprotein carrier protein LolA [Leptospiraceae bacterium]